MDESLQSGARKVAADYGKPSILEPQQELRLEPGVAVEVRVDDRNLNALRGQQKSGRLDQKAGGHTFTYTAASLRKRPARRLCGYLSAYARSVARRVALVPAGRRLRCSPLAGRAACRESRPRKRV
eukprot:3346042-Pleurochrysis_carterae.AAC.3